MGTRNISIIFFNILSLSVSVMYANSLPPVTNPNLNWLGYYFVDQRYGNDTADVFPYTNLYIAIPSGYITDDSNWQGLLDESLQRAVSAGQKIYLIMVNGVQGQQTITWDSILDVADIYWNHVEFVEFLAETNLSRTQTEAKITLLKQKLAARGLAQKPFGALYTRAQILTTDGIYAPSMSFAAVETYVTPPGNADYAVDVNAMNSFMDNVTSRVGAAGKHVFFVMQAYDRSVTWTNPDALEHFQQPVYLKSYNDPVVIGINMFSFNRPGGTKTYPEIQFRHYPIAERMLGPIDWGVDTRFNISSHVVNEGSSLTLAVRALTPEGGPTMRPITVDYSTVAGTARAGSDYVHKQGTLTFARGQSSKTITVQTLSDGAAEGTEVFYIRLSNGEGTNVGSPNEFTLSIINQ